MNHTKQFIEDAVAGGWKKSWLNDSDADILLDAKAWEAVEKHHDKSASDAIIRARAKETAIEFMRLTMQLLTIEKALTLIYESKNWK